MIETIEIKNVTYQEYKHPLSRFKKWVCKVLNIDRVTLYATIIETYSPFTKATMGDVITFLNTTGENQYMVTGENKLSTLAYSLFRSSYPIQAEILILSRGYSEGSI